LGCPLSPRKLPRPSLAGASARANTRHRQPLFNHLVGEGEELVGDSHVKHFRRFQIDDEFKLCGLLNWQICRIGAPQNLVDVDCAMPIDVAVVWPVRHKPAGIYKGPISVHHDEALFVRKLDELLEIDEKQWI